MKQGNFILLNAFGATQKSKSLILTKKNKFFAVCAWQAQQKVDNIDICLNAFDKIILDNKKKEVKKIIKKEEKEIVNEEEKEDNNYFSNNSFFFNPYNKL